MILQLYDLVYLITGIAAAVASGFVDEEGKTGKLDLWYQ